MRVLGGQIHCLGSIAVEVSKRLGALKSSFHALGKFWSAPGVAFRLRRSVLLGIQNVGTQNLEAFLVTKGQCKRIDSTFIKHCRVAMQGGASREGPDHIRTMTNEYVLRHWRLVPSFLELRVRRLNWLVQFIRYPKRRAQILTALFAELPVDE
eukprot:8718579-Pyramimonas_sp.AAC.1